MDLTPTDAIANDLSIRLFLFGLAAMSFYEALKLERPRAYIAWAACLLFFASGAALRPISAAWPSGVRWLGDLAANPVTWFVLAMSVYLILRPRWSRPPGQENTADRATLASSALESITDSIGQIRAGMDSLQLELSELKLETDRKLKPIANIQKAVEVKARLRQASSLWCSVNEMWEGMRKKARDPRLASDQLFMLYWRDAYRDFIDGMARFDMALPLERSFADMSHVENKFRPVPNESEVVGDEECLNDYRICYHLWHKARLELRPIIKESRDEAYRLVGSIGAALATVEVPDIGQG